MPGGVLEHGAQEEDDPGTWEALVLPRKQPERRRAGDPSPTPVCKRTAHEAVEKRVRDEVGHRQGATGAEADGDEGVGGLQSSEDVGERLAFGPGGVKAARVDVIFRRAPWPKHRLREACHRDF